MPSNTLEYAEVTIQYHREEPPILNLISFSMAPGERVALLGLNGSGKTSLLLAAAGLVPHHGRITINDIEVSEKNLSHIREQIGFLFNVPEDQLLFPQVLEDVAFSLLRRNVAKKDAFFQAQQMLDSLGVRHLAESPLHHLSHGQKQRVALAGCLITKPSLLLLDEPTSGLDPIGKRQLAQLLKNQEAAMLVATHDLDFAQLLCTRYLLLEEGQLIEEPAGLAAIRSRWE